MKKNLCILILLAAGCSSGPSLQNDDRARTALNDLYQKGIQERINNQADDCLRTFKNLIELRKQLKDSLYVYSLYQSGLCYEMKNAIDHAIAVYQDAARSTGVVPAEFYKLEIPSRLAICYSKLGDQQVAEKYYKQSQKYLELLQQDRTEIASKKEHYAEILYEMGLITNNFQRGADFNSYLKSIKFAQEYLTLALELNVDPYSQYAAQQLLNNFQSTYDYIAQLKPEPSGDEVVSARMNQDEQKRLSEILLHHMDEFKDFVKNKRAVKNEKYKSIFSEIEDLQKKLESIVQERPIGEGLTPEAQKYQDPKIEGQMIPVPGEIEDSGPESEKK